MPQPSHTPGIIQTIRIEADRAGVPRQIALAFAWVESKFEPTLQGDLKWHEKQQGALYKRFVLGNMQLVANPARDIPAVWHSYGLYQLLAPFHVLPSEHPRALLDPRVNAERGIAYIAKLLAKAHNNVHSARFAYVGGGYDGRLLGEEQRKLVTTRIDLAMTRFQDG